MYRRKMTARNVYDSCPRLYHAYHFDNFSSNFYSLRLSIKALCDAFDFDQRALNKLPPRPALTERGEPFWDRSAAQRILRAELTDEDISLILNELEPREVREPHIEYRAFELATFHNHLYKEDQRLKTGVY
jgi:hypothetical protein